MNRINKLVIIFFAAAILSNCEGPEGQVGPTGVNSLFNIVSEASGANCTSGGLKIQTGLDKNSNNTLDNDEITNTNFLCNGQNGLNSLIKVLSEPVGANCLAGGLKIESGFDKDADGILDADEIQISRFVCNGTDGGFDEEIRMSFGQSFLWSSDINWTMSNNQIEHLLLFDKRNYLDADSIVVGMRLATTNVNTKCYAELFNITDGVPISNSEVSSNILNTQPLTYTFSENIFNNLPEYPINLGLRIRTETNGVQVIGGFPTHLFIYRKGKK